ncbi:uncharacterized protein DSM5745_00103 [Aspergillus mulundensis]|uniref:DUF6594 domain-containing protein n=1 Tax=Aspergillus mulundensis TaxID=1810919 RepID=A0A3D8T2V9_9EURO|nr:hypothetical protein DSM5745_00103 [Aspergillus mulundensis]RDW92781.1 hypothetical protein DSM5745_00103 [Aspergillus mulundensis]
MADQAAPAQVASLPLFTRAELERHAHKLVGYRGYSELVSSDGDFSHYRRFDRLNAHVTLMLQDEIVELEAQLEERELEARKPPRQNASHNGAFRSKAYKDRKAILHKAKAKLERYYAYITTYIRLRNCAETTDRERESLKQWQMNNDQTIHENERGYLEKEDLIRTVPKDPNPMRDLLVNSSLFRSLPFWRPRHHEGQLPYYVGEDSVIYAEDWIIDLCAKLLIVALGLILLLAPIWLLAYLDELLSKLALVSVFIFSFSALLTALTRDSLKTIEFFSAIAGYSAILMVYMGSTHK